MRLVLVTGAGASRELGHAGQLPLMPDWAAELRRELNSRESGLADAIGLTAGMSGPDFEETLGALLRWRDLRALNERFRALGGPKAGQYFEQVVQAYDHEGQRLDSVLTGINETLFRLFGAGRIDDDAAVSAYAKLLKVVGHPNDLTVITTNYDPAAEIALLGLGRVPDTGFTRPPGRAPVLDPAGVVERSRGDDDAVAVLHLHGAVGWYEDDGVVHEQHQDQDYNATLGRPVVLYPDPDKDPTRDAVVQSLWHEFDVALEEATHVIVLGHSLHDRALVDKLMSASRHLEHMVVCLYRGLDDSVYQRSAERILDLFSGAFVNVVPANFSPRGDDLVALESALAARRAA
jgi:hypothetical protein